MFCNKTFGETVSWVRYHQFWIKYKLKVLVPNTIIHYEHITIPHHSCAVMNQILQFLNETELDQGTISTRISNVLKQPIYQHDTLFSQICGISAARKLHRATKNVFKIY